MNTVSGRGQTVKSRGYWAALECNGTPQFPTQLIDIDLQMNLPVCLLESPLLQHSVPAKMQQLSKGLRISLFITVTRLWKDQEN